jgi:hypothetical protein
MKGVKIRRRQSLTAIAGPFENGGYQPLVAGRQATEQDGSVMPLSSGERSFDRAAEVPK